MDLIGGGEVKGCLFSVPTHQVSLYTVVSSLVTWCPLSHMHKTALTPSRVASTPSRVFTIPHPYTYAPNFIPCKGIHFSPVHYAAQSNSPLLLYRTLSLCRFLTQLTVLAHRHPRPHL